MNNADHLLRHFDNRFVHFIYSLSIFTPVMMMAIIIVVGQITPDYNPVSETISQMGARERPYSVVLNSSYIIYGMIIIGIVYSLYRKLFHTNMIKTLAVLLVIHAVGSIFLAVFPDKPDTSGGYFSENIIHNTFSGISYIALLLGILIYSMAALKVKSTKIIAIAGIAVVSINLAMPLINVVNYLNEISGILQRFFIFCSFSWIIVLSILLYRRLLLNRYVCTIDVKILQPSPLPCRKQKAT
jgi:hypothetical membrane protein